MGDVLNFEFYVCVIFVVVRKKLGYDWCCKVCGCMVLLVWGVDCEECL